MSQPSNQGVLENKIALITGAGTGIGAASALRFAEAGATVVVCDIDAQQAAVGVAAIQASGGRAEAAPCDVTDIGALQQLVADVAQRHGRLDILFNNAGGATPTPTHQQSEQD